MKVIKDCSKTTTRRRKTSFTPISVVPMAALLLASCSSFSNHSVDVAAFSLGPRMPQRPAFVSRQGPSVKAAAQVSPLFAETSSPSIDKSVDDEVQKKREDLKRRLLEAADIFKAVQASVNKAEIEANSVEKVEQKGEGRVVVRLLRRIVAKIMRRKTEKPKRTVLRSDAFGTAVLEVGEAGNATIALAEELAKLNPTQVPTYGFKGYGGGSPSDCKLGGQWKLRFTTAADATFSESPKRGSISTSQEIDADKGTLTNVVDFERGKLKGFRVVVAGDPTSDDEIELTFRKVEILRNSRLFKKLAFPIPARLLRAVNRYLSKGKASKRGPYFQLQYLDDDLRMHKTGEGNWFIQSRL